MVFQRSTAQARTVRWEGGKLNLVKILLVKVQAAHALTNRPLRVLYCITVLQVFEAVKIECFLADEQETKQKTKHKV